MYELYCMYCVFFIPGIRWRHSLRNRSQTMTSLSPDTVRRIEDAAAALIAAGTPNPTNEQVRQHLGGGSLSHISPVMRAFRARQREQATPLPPELAQLLTGQLGLLWQAAVKQAEAGALAAREQADDDIARADKERDEALANVAALESELAVLREVVAERDRLLQEVRELREQVARLTATGEHLAAQLQDTKAELKEAREDGRQLQTELLALARQDGKVKK
ncbi:DNA-binding protein [Salmonella enterica subsp. enterica serovar Typhimurium]